MFQKKYIFGDTAVYYLETPVEGHENKTVVGLALYPKDEKIDPEKLCLDSLVQVAFTVDECLIAAYALALRTGRATSICIRLNIHGRRAYLP